MDSERPPNLRTVGSPGEQAAAGTGVPPLASGMAINATAELVVDLLAATGLVAPDKLALVRGRAGQGSLAQAIVDEGVAPPEGIARSLAVRYQVPLVDLALTGVARDAAERTVRNVRDAGPGVPVTVVDLSREALGSRIGRAPLAAVGVPDAKAAGHLLRTLRRLRDAG